MWGCQKDVKAPRGQIHYLEKNHDKPELWILQHMKGYMADKKTTWQWTMCFSFMFFFWFIFGKSDLIVMHHGAGFVAYKFDFAAQQ